jgi:O-antigen chain-terminating methyltransferase
LIRHETAAVRQDLSAELAGVRQLVRNTELFAHQTRATMCSLEGRLSLILQERMRAGAAQNLPTATPVSELDLSAKDLGPLYVEFEDIFRGQRAEIKERVVEYLPRLVAKNIGTPHMPVLDLGCGRGEWLEVLGERGFTGVGVDSNETCVADCRDRNLTVHIADLIEYLQQQPSDTQGVITAFHVVEHLPFRLILNLLNEAVRVLKPGGMLILETPNPANLIVGAHTFYLDPSHVRPLPADLLRFMVESRGFSNVEVLPLHPFPDCYRLEDKSNAAAALLNDLVYGPRDYAVIAERP